MYNTLTYQFVKCPAGLVPQGTLRFGSQDRGTRVARRPATFKIHCPLRSHVDRLLALIRKPPQRWPLAFIFHLYRFLVTRINNTVPTKTIQSPRCHLMRNALKFLRNGSVVSILLFDIVREERRWTGRRESKIEEWSRDDFDGLDGSRCAIDRPVSFLLTEKHASVFHSQVRQWGGLLVIIIVWHLIRKPQVTGTVKHSAPRGLAAIDTANMPRECEVHFH